MRIMLAVSAVCAALVTTAFLLFAFIKGEDYYRALALTPEQVRSNVASRRQSAGQRIDAAIWRIRDRKRAVVVARIMAESGRVFAASPETARDMLHLRLMVAEHMSSDPRWIRLAGTGQRAPGGTRGLTGIELSPTLVDIPALDAARVFWEQAQSAYDTAGRARMTAPLFQGLELSVERVPFEARMRARRAGCLFLAAGTRLGINHDGAALADDCGTIPNGLVCVPLAAELVIESSRSGGAINGVACAELERASAGDPLSLERFRPEWNGERCLERARTVVQAPGWHGSEALCAEAEARAKARGLGFIRPMR